MSIFRRRRVRRTRAGTYRIDLAVDERGLLRRLTPQLRELLTEGADDRVRRLFPTAYPNDAEADAEYQGLVHDDLVAGRLAALDVMDATLDLTEATDEQLLAWMGSINAIRLVLGTMLDVSEDLDVTELPEDHPELQGHLIYAYLSGLLDEIVGALDEGLPPPRP